MAATSPVSAMAPERKKKRYRQDIVKENIEVWLMMLPVLVIIFIFSYIPLWGGDHRLPGLSARQPLL